jgi:hypothetical protein
LGVERWAFARDFSALGCLLAKAFGVGLPAREGFRSWTFSSLSRIAFFNHFTGAISPDGRIVATGSSLP